MADISRHMPPLFASRYATPSFDIFADFCRFSFTMRLSIDIFDSFASLFSSTAISTCREMPEIFSRQSQQLSFSQQIRHSCRQLSLLKRRRCRSPFSPTGLSHYATTERRRY
jgi:hypothetical protein